MRRIVSFLLAVSLLAINIASDISAAEVTATDTVKKTAELETQPDDTDVMDDMEIVSQEKEAQEIMYQAARAATNINTVLTNDKWEKTCAFSCVTKRNSASASVSFGSTLSQKNSFIPGLLYTSFGSGGCRDMVPQGIAYVEGYIMISAYCANDYEHNSVLYVLNKGTYEYICTFNLGLKVHVGGLAYDPHSMYLWVCDSQKKRLVAYDMQWLNKYYIHDGMAADGKIREINACAEKGVDIKPSYCTYADGIIWVGKCDEKNESSVHAYVANNAYLHRGAWMVCPAQTQGMSIYRSGKETYCVFTTSYGRKNNSKVVSYKIDDYTVKIGSVQMKLTPVKTITMPCMMEGIATNGGFTAAVFESAAKKYRADSKNPCDRLAVFYTKYIYK